MEETLLVLVSFRLLGSGVVPRFSSVDCRSPLRESFLASGVETAVAVLPVAWLPAGRSSVILTTL